MNEPQITLSGHVAAAPVLRMAAGTPVTSFRIGATPRRYDKATDSWSDTETLWFTVTAWRSLAEHCVTSLAKGDKVVVAGRLRQSTWRAEDGTARTGLEVDAASVGLDLSRSSALSTRRSNGSRTTTDGAEPAADGEDRAESGTAGGAEHGGEHGGDDDGGWLSTGLVDDATGEVLLTPALPEQDPAERAPAGV